jgi:acyl dehydratase
VRGRKRARPTLSENDLVAPSRVRESGRMSADRPQLGFEDLTPGRVYETASVDVSGEEVTAFATRYDPQPFHVDPVAARATIFGGQVASGWMTAALTMRLMVTGQFGFGEGAVGLGVETLQWPKPVRPGDTLRATVEVLSARGSSSKPTHGIVKIRTTTLNQRDETVQLMVSNVLLPRRRAAA